MNWCYNERQKKQKFDSIGDGHLQAMISMGIIKDLPEKKEEGPRCPSIFIETFDKYRDIKFLQREHEGTVYITPRGVIRWQDLEAYKSATGNTIGLLEADLIMRIDAIFEGRDND